MRFQFFNVNCTGSRSCVDNRNTCEDFVPGWETQYTSDEVWIRAYGVGRNPEVARFLVANEKLVDDENGPYFQLRYADGDRLDSDQTIEIWDLSANGTARGDTLLQRVTFHASCSQPLLCLNAFGASTLVTFRNQDQSLVECLDAVNTTFTVTFPLDITGVETAFRIIRAQFETDFTRPRIVTFNEISDQVFQPGEQLAFPLEFFLDPRRDAVLNADVAITIVTIGTEDEPPIVCVVRQDLTQVFVGIQDGNLTATCDDFNPLLVNNNDLLEFQLNYDP
eukprot:scaffold1168_cov167-Amphora_coffeaeformis.AAC.48